MAPKNPGFEAAVQRALAAERRAPGAVIPVTLPELKASPSPVIARGRKPVPRAMTGIEASYDAQLAIEVAAGEVLWYRYEGITLKLADDTRYTPDFFILNKDGTLDCVEVKGPFRREDSFVKLKAAASMFPFRFLLVTRPDGKWAEKEIKP